MLEQKQNRKRESNMNLNQGKKVFITNLKTYGFIEKVDEENKELEIVYYKNNEQKKDKFAYGDVEEVIEKDELIFAKVKDNAIIPSKEKEDGGYDVYACLEKGQDKKYKSIKFESFEIKEVPTGVASSLPLGKYRIKFRERGSSGKFGLALRSGLIDSGYRGEWFVAVQNMNNKKLEITDAVEEPTETEKVKRWPLKKAFAQACLEFLPRVYVRTINYEDLKQVPSKRGEGKEGASGK